MQVGVGGNIVCNRPLDRFTFSPVDRIERVTLFETCNRERKRTLFDRLFRRERCGPEGRFWQERTVSVHPMPPAGEE